MIAYYVITIISRFFQAIFAPYHSCYKAKAALVVDGVIDMGIGMFLNSIVTIPEHIGVPVLGFSDLSKLVFILSAFHKLSGFALLGNTSSKGLVVIVGLGFDNDNYLEKIHI